MILGPEDNHTSSAEARSRNSMQAKEQPNLVERLSPSLSWNTDRAKVGPGRQRLGTSVASGVLGIAPAARAPTIGGFVALDDPDGGFSGLPRGRADGTMAAPLLQLVSRDGLGPCVHETPGSRQWNVSVSPGNWSEWSPRAEIEGFEISGAVATLAVEDEPRSITNGTIRIASTEPGFPPAEVSRSIHRCEYDPATGACPLCGETHDTTGVSITVTQDYRYALFGETNMSRFAATAHGGNADDVVWTVSPELADGVWLHASDDPESVGEGEIAGVAQVWADSGLSTNQFTVTASFTFAPSQSVSTTFTTIAIDAEPICTETDTSGFVVNPCMVPTGESATFRIKVFPSSVPDSHICWNLSGGHAQFVGSRYGREVRVRGTGEGPVHLEVVLDGYNGVNPTFDTYVADMVAVPVDAWIVVGDGGTVCDSDHVSSLVQDANAILRQVCMTCYVHEVLYTNRNDWVDLSSYGDDEYEDALNLITSVSNRCNGIEVHFVGQLKPLDEGSNNHHGIVLHSNSSAQTFVHEIGHEMGLADIYGIYINPNMVLAAPTQQSWAPSDWSGENARGFYKPDFRQVNLVRRLIMCGDGNAGRRDFSTGPVYGIVRDASSPTGMGCGMAPVGMSPFPPRRVPHHD